MIASGIFFVNASMEKSIRLKEFESSLSDEQKKIMIDIVNERIKIMIFGVCVGLLASFGVYMLTKPKNFNGAMFLISGVTLLTSYFWYILFPKKKYMIETLNSSEQIKLWNEVYKVMQNRFHYGLLFGMIMYLAYNYWKRTNF